MRVLVTDQSLPTPSWMFLHGVRRQCLVMRVFTCQRELLLVLEDLAKEPHEPLQWSSLKALTIRMAELALTLAKRVRELIRLPSQLTPVACILLHGDLSDATLRMNSSFVSKSIRSLFRSRAKQLDGFCPPSHAGEKEAVISCLWAMMMEWLEKLYQRSVSLNGSKPSKREKTLLLWSVHSGSMVGVSGPFQWFECRGHIYSSDMVYALSVHKVVSLCHDGCISWKWLLLWVLVNHSQPALMRKRCVSPLFTHDPIWTLYITLHFLNAPWWVGVMRWGFCLWPGT